MNRWKPTGVAALLAMAMALIFSGCGEDARAAPPPRPDFSMEIQQATDSTVVARADWSGQADLWRWVLEQGDGTRFDSGEFSDTTAVELTLPRVDSSYTAIFCVHGVNVRGTDEAAGNEACGSGPVPARPLVAPDAPELQFEVDTATALRVDSVTVEPPLVIFTPPDGDREVDSLWVARAFDRDSVMIDSVGSRSYAFRADLWRGGDVVGCSGDCPGDRVAPSQLVRIRDGSLETVAEAIWRTVEDPLRGAGHLTRGESPRLSPFVRAGPGAVR